MKRIISVLLLFSVGIYLTACGGAETNEKQGAQDVAEWTVELAVDEFGDVIESSNPILKCSIKGDFSNSATTSSELGGYVFITPDDLGTSFSVVFRMFEYNSSPVTFTMREAENIVLKTKVGDDISEYQLAAIEPNGDLYLYGASGSDAAQFILNLHDGHDIRCIINIENSQYNFTVKSGNIMEASNEATAISNAQVESGLVDLVDECLGFYLNRTEHEQRADFIRKYASSFPYLNTEEIEEMLNDKIYLQMDVATLKDSSGEYSNGTWFVFQFKNNERWQLAHIKDLKTAGQYFADNPKGGSPCTIQNDQFTISANAGKILTDYKVQKIRDGYYLVTRLSSTSQDLYLYAECDGLGNVLYSVGE